MAVDRIDSLRFFEDRELQGCPSLRPPLALFGIPGEPVMTKEQNGTAPDLIILGQDNEGKPRAARFPVSQADLVAKAAKAMILTVSKADGAALAELAKKLPIGRLYATGPGFVPPVGRNLYGKIVEQLQFAGQPVPAETDQSDADQPAPGLPTTWDDIAVGHLVIAQEAKWDGWWEAIVLARDGDMLTLKWRDYPWQSNVVRHAGSAVEARPGQHLTIVTTARAILYGPSTFSSVTAVR